MTADDLHGAVSTMMMAMHMMVVPVDDPLPVAMMVVMPAMDGDAAGADVNVLSCSDSRRHEEGGGCGDDGQFQLHVIAPYKG